MDIIKYKEKGKTKQEAQKLMNSRFQLDLEIRCICDRTLIKTESQKSFDYTNPNNKKCRTNIFEALFNGMILNLLWEWVHDRICAYLDRILVRLILEIDAWKKKKNGIDSTMSWNGFCRSIVVFLSVISLSMKYI